MRNLAELVMRGRRQAILLALLFAVLPFFGWLGDVVVALVALRKGAKEGALVLLWAVLPAVTFGLMGYPQIWLYSIIGGSLTVYVLALGLRYTCCWNKTIQMGVMLGVAGVVVCHLLAPNINQQWFEAVLPRLNILQKRLDLGLDAVAMQQFALLLSKIATGVQVGLLLFANLFNLALARWGQALLYNPQGLAIELRGLRMGFLPVCLLVLAGLGSLGGVEVAIDSLPVIALPFVLAGISLLHEVMFFTKGSKWWLLGFYALFVLFFIYFAVALVLVALADAVWDVRHRLQIRM